MNIKSLKSLKLLRRPVLAVQWDRSTVDYFLAERRAGHVHVIAAGTEVWHTDEESTSPGEVIKGIISRSGGRRPEVLVGLNRSQVDVIPLQLPPAGDDELPVLVVNQVVRDAGELAESGVIDYVSLATETAEGRQVFAFVADAATLEQVNTECSKAGLTPAAILYRPLGAVSALRRMVPGSRWVMILVTLHDEDADLSIVRGADLLYTRTARIGKTEDNAALARQLAVEIQRSVAAASLTPDADGQHVYVFGSLSEYQSLVEELADELSLPVSLLDPLRLESKEGEPPARVGRLAPLLGMVYEHIDGSHPLDFCHPKEPPPPPNYWRQIAKGAAALAVVLAIGAYYLWDVRAQRNEEISDMRRSIKQVASQLDRLGRKQAVVDAVRGWENDSINWLDELYDVTLRFPSGDDAMVRRLTIGGGRAGTGVIDMAVQVRSPDVVTELGDKLRDPFHEVRSQRVSEQKAATTYPWQFDTRVTLRRRDVAQYRASIAAESGNKQVPVGQPVTVSTEKK